MSAALILCPGYGTVADRVQGLGFRASCSLGLGVLGFRVEGYLDVWCPTQGFLRSSTVMSSGLVACAADASAAAFQLGPPAAAM